MPDWVAWLGWVIGFVAFLLNIQQYITNRSNRQNLIALKGELQSLSEICKDALKEEAFKNPDRMYQALKDMGQITVSAKKSVDTLLPAKPPRNDSERQLPE